MPYLELGDRAAAIAVLRQLPDHMRRRSIEEVDELAPLADEVG